MKVNQKYANNFIKVPNNLITSVSEYNDYVLTIYSFVGFNKNMMGQVVTNIDTLKEYFVKNENNKKDYTYSRDKKIIEALMILTNGTYVGDEEVISDSYVGVKFPYGVRDKYSLCTEFGEIRLDSNTLDKSLESVVNGLYTLIENDVGFNDFSKFNLTIDINDDTVDGNFTQFFVYEYCALYNIYKSCVNNKMKIKFCHLVNMYLYIKSVISRHASLNKKFNDNIKRGKGWKNKEYVTYGDLLKRYNNYKAFVELYVEVLRKNKVIYLNDGSSGEGNGENKKEISKKDMIITLKQESKKEKKNKNKIEDKKIEDNKE